MRPIRKHTIVSHTTAGEFVVTHLFRTVVKVEEVTRNSQNSPVLSDHPRFAEAFLAPCCTQTVAS